MCGGGMRIHLQRLLECLDGPVEVHRVDPAASDQKLRLLFLIRRARPDRLAAAAPQPGQEDQCDTIWVHPQHHSHKLEKSIRASNRGLFSPRNNYFPPSARNGFFRTPVPVLTRAAANTPSTK